MIAPNESLWSFAYSIGQSRFSFEIVAPTQEVAESALRTAICEGAICPSSVCEVPQLSGEASKS